MKFYCSILFSLLVFLSFAQKAFVSLSVDAKNTEIGAPVTFSVKSNIEGNVEISFPKEFIQGYGSMSGMEQEIDHNTGTVSTIYYFSQNGSFSENGSFSIYAYVKNRKAIYKSNKITVKVEKDAANSVDEKEISKKNQNQAVFGIIQKSKTKIYEGEPLVLEAKIYSKLDINMLESYESFEIEGGSEIKEIDKTNNLLLKKENYKGNQYLTFNYGKQVVFPSSTGKLKIKPFEMSLQYRDGGIFSDRIAFTSNPSNIEIIPLPSNAPEDFIGGVGKFDCNYKVNKTTIKENDVISLEIVISGTGNLHNVDKPKLNLPKGLIIYGDPEIKENINFGNNGAEGSIVYIYNLQAVSGGTKKIPAISISYFDPNQKKYVSVKKEAVQIKVLQSEKVAETEDVLTKNDEANENKLSEETNDYSAINAKSQNASFTNSIWFWPTVLSPLVLVFIGGLFFFKNKGFVTSNKNQIPQKTVSLPKSIRLNATNEIKAKLESSRNLHQRGNTKEAFEELENAIKSFIFVFIEKKDSNYSNYEFFEILKENKLSDVNISVLNKCLLDCEEARYSFDTSSLNFKDSCSNAEKVLNEIC